MKIVIVGPVDMEGKKEGGVSAYMNNLIRTLREMKIPIKILGISQGKVLSRSSDLVVIAKGEKVLGINFLINLFVKAPFIKISDYIIHAQRPDMLLPFVFLHPDTPLVCTLHGNPTREIHHKWGKPTGTIYDFLERIVLRKTSKIIAVGETIKEYYVKKYAAIESKTVIIPIGINVEKFRPLNKIQMRKKYGFKYDDKIILYVGRIAKEKNLKLLIESFKEIKSRLDSAKLVLVGDGKEKIPLERFVRESDLNDVLFLGRINHDKIPELMNCADVLALCSLYEGSPTVVKEALACGIPVVSTDVGDVKEVIKDGETGYVVNGSPENIATGLSKALNNTEKFKENCIEVAKQYSWDKIAERTLEVYQNLSKKA